jgi:hypothetical protein
MPKTLPNFVGSIVKYKLNDNFNRMSKILQREHINLYDIFSNGKQSTTSIYGWH